MADILVDLGGDPLIVTEFLEVHGPFVGGPPDNGPEIVPPPPGPPAIDGYEYIIVPRQTPLPADQPFYQIFGVYQQIESTFAAVGAFADRIDLWDGRRAYRVPLRYMYRFGKDANGAFIGYPPLPRFRFSPVDPTTGIPKVNEWTPYV